MGTLIGTASGDTVTGTACGDTVTGTAQCRQRPVQKTVEEMHMLHFQSSLSQADTSPTLLHNVLFLSASLHARCQFKLACNVFVQKAALQSFIVRLLGDIHLVWNGEVLFVLQTIQTEKVVTRRRCSIHMYHKLSSRNVPK